MTYRLRALRAIAAGVLTVGFVFGVGVSAVHASIDDIPSPVLMSSTNPGAIAGAGDTPDTWWRMGWGNALYPSFVLNLPPSVVSPAFVIGTLYTVDRSPATVIDTSHPDGYYRSAQPQGTHLSQIIDLPGIAAFPPPGVAVEGLWYYHYRFFSNYAYSSSQVNVPIGIDVTPPGRVTGLSASPALGVTGDPDAWFASKRTHVTWDAGSHDALSGDAYYQILIDGQPAIPNTEIDPSQGRVYAIPGMVMPSSVTIEDMPPGRHKISVAVVDRATNQGPTTDTYFNSDPDVPTISLSVPPIVGRFATAMAVPADAGGIRYVDFFVDDNPVGRVSSPPYNLPVDMTPFGPAAHTFSARVTDMLMRTETASTDSVTDPESAFRTGIFTTLGGFRYPGADGSSPLRYFSVRSVTVGLEASRSVDGFAYVLSRSATTLPSVPGTSADPPTAIFAPTGLSSPMSLDLASWQRVQTSAAESLVGLTDPIEGVWYLTAKAMIASEFPPLSSTYRRVKFVVDVTAPRVPTGLGVVGAPAAGAWAPSARRDIQWRNPGAAGLVQYDALSGDAFYIITVNGAEVARQPPVAGWPLNSYSIESLLPGRNTIGVSVVDNAGNRGREALLTVLADPDVPTIVSTSAGSVGRYATLTSTPSDGAGVASVSYYVNGSFVGSAGSAPWAIVGDLARFGTGGKTVTAVVTDMAGRTANASSGIWVADLTVPSISRMKGAPQPFYPLRRDRYRDTMKVSYRLSERAYVTLQIFDAGGVLVREIGGWRKKGSNSFVWNGQRADGTTQVGGYTYRLVANDGAYNISVTGRGYTEIRAFYLKRISRSRVRVVFS